jgi:hypothetical protein
MVFHMKPLAWHSSSAVMISSQPERKSLESKLCSGITDQEDPPTLSLVWR